MALHLYNPGTDALAANPHDTVVRLRRERSPGLPKIAALPSGEAQDAAELVRWPQRLGRESFYRVAYPLMFLSRRLEERLLELFQKGYVKGTVTISIGNEATAVGMSMPLRPGCDVLSLLHRDLGAHLLLGATPYQLLCQYLANADSPTHACEGNVHHGDAASRRFPMMSHLGKMLSVVVGGTWAARRNGEQVFGLAVIGDGGTSTGEFHESLNIASVHKVPVLFLIENNHYAFSTPTSVQYNCRRLSDRAVGYGISGRTIDGTDPWTVYSAVCEAIDAMEESSLPVLAGVRHASLVRSCRLRQGPVRSGRIDGAMAEGRSRSSARGIAWPKSAALPNHRLPASKRPSRRKSATRSPVPWPSAGRRPPQQWPVHAEAVRRPTTPGCRRSRDAGDVRRSRRAGHCRG